MTVKCAIEYLESEVKTTALPGYKAALEVALEVLREKEEAMNYDD